MKADLPSLDKAPGAGRQRDPRIDSAILSATAELLVQIGYSNLSLAAVAERAGTTKSALYRRWSEQGRTSARGRVSRRAHRAAGCGR